MRPKRKAALMMSILGIVVLVFFHNSIQDSLPQMRLLRFFYLFLDRKVNMLSLLIFPISIIAIQYYEMKKEDESILFFLIPVVLLSSFVLTNIQIMICRDFRGFYSLWDYGDFSNVNVIRDYTSGNIYSHNYPPLAVFIYYLANRIIPDENYDNSIRYISFVYNLISCFSIYFLFVEIIENRKYKNLLSFSILLSYPVLYTIGRGNVTIIAFVLVLGFVWIYESKDDRFCVLASVLLSMAANIKLFPFVFVWMFVKKRKWKSVALTVIFSAIIFLFPAIISGSPVENVKLFMHSLGGFASGVKEYGGISLSIRHMTSVFLSFVGSTNSNINSYIEIIILILYIVGSGFLLIKSKRDSDTLLALSLICILIPDVSYWYSLIYLLVPFAVFLREGVDIHKKSDMILYFVYLMQFMLSYTYAIYASNRYFSIIIFLSVLTYRVIFDNEKLKNK